jgi:hypothetical protein
MVGRTHRVGQSIQTELLEVPRFADNPIDTLSSDLIAPPDGQPAEIETIVSDVSQEMIINQGRGLEISFADSPRTKLTLATMARPLRPPRGRLARSRRIPRSASRQVESGIMIRKSSNDAIDPRREGL